MRSKKITKDTSRAEAALKGRDELEILIKQAYGGIEFQRREAVLAYMNRDREMQQSGKSSELQKGGGHSGESRLLFPEKRFGERFRTLAAAGTAAAAAAVLVSGIYLSVLLDVPAASPVAAAEKQELVVLGEKPFAAVQLASTVNRR
jgi:hypothetical protein